MVFRGRCKQALDTDQTPHPDDVPQDTAHALADAAEAEAEAVEARAAAARARAVRLRQQAEATAGRYSEAPDGADTDDDDTLSDAPATGTALARGPLARPPRRKAVAVGAAATLMVASLAASGYIAWHHRIASQQRQHAAEFAAAARDDVVALMSLDFNRSTEDMQRIADRSIGNFKQQFPAIADQLAKGLQRNKVVTTVTINDAAVESMTTESAVVLVAATTQAKEGDGAPEPRAWQVAVSLLRDGGQPKMSRVEFVQ
jgi:Mce-associated membrane protein